MFSKIINLFVLRVLGALLGLAYSILIVYYFGKSRTVEIFFVSNSLLYIVTSLTQSGQLSEIFLPEYARLKNQFGKEISDKAFSVVINRLLCWMAILLLFFLFTADLWADVMAPTFSSDEKSLIASMFRVMLIQFVLVIINSFITTVLNAEKIYGKAEFASILNGGISILAIIAFQRYQGAWVLVYSLLLGRIVELGMSVSLLKKTNFKYSFIFKVPEFDHNSFFKVVRHTFLYVSATQIYYVVFTSMATTLSPGIYAIFSHVQNIINKIQGILLGPVSTVFFSEYANKTHGKNEDSSTTPSQLLENTIVHTQILIMSFICIIGPLALEVIRLLMYNKTLSAPDLTYAANLFHLFMFGILFSATGGLFRKAVISKGYSKIVYSWWTGVQLLTGLLAYLLMFYFGETGLLIISPINILMLNAVSYMVYYYTREHEMNWNQRTLIRLLVVSLITYLLVSLFRNVLVEYCNHWVVLGVILPLALLVQVFMLKIFRVIDMFSKIRSLITKL